MAKIRMEAWRRSARRLLGIGLVLGILVGLFVGWRVWPVIWYDTDPSDLRMAHQTNWVLMAADSLAITGDVAAARQRVYELLDDDTTLEQVADLMSSIASQREADRDSAGALRVRRLAQAVGMPSPGESEFEPPRKRIGAPNKATGYLVLVGAAIVAVALLVRYLATRVRVQTAHVQDTPAARVRKASKPKPPPAPTASSRSVPLSWASERPSPGPPESSQASASVEGAGQSAVTRQFAWSESHAPTEEKQPLRRREGRPADFVPMPMIANSMPSAETPDETLGRFEAQYNLGDDEFDASFTITSAEGEFLGECGLGISDVSSSEGARQVGAFEIWLFDRAEIRTVSRFLVSEHASQDEATRARLAEKGDLVVPRSGLTFLVETLSLGLSVTITDVAYGEDLRRPHSYFSRLGVEMVAKRIDSPVV